jgi:hypothetical protein
VYTIQKILDVFFLKVLTQLCVLCSKLDIRVVKKGKPLSRGKKESEDSLPLSLEPSIQEDISLSQLTMSFSSILSSNISSRNIGRQHSFLTSTRLFGSSDQRSIITNKSVFSSF